MVTIYMPLLDEGTDVWRPVEATHLGGDLYRVHGPIPEGEVWAFHAETMVRCEHRTFTEGGVVLTAIKQGTR